MRRTPRKMAKRVVARLSVVGRTLLVILASPLWAANLGMSTTEPADASIANVSELVAQFTKAGTPSERGKLLEKVRSAVPSNATDISALEELSRQPMAHGVAMKVLQAVQDPMDEPTRGAYVKLIERSDGELLEVALSVCASHRVAEAIPVLRKQLRDVHRHQIRSDKDLQSLSVRAAAGDPLALSAFVTTARGEALAALGDVDSVDLLFSLDEVLCTGRSGHSLVKLGLPALLKAVQVARAETGLRRKGALMVIDSCTSANEVSTLQNLLRDPDAGIRSAATVALTSAEGADEMALIQTLSATGDVKNLLYTWVRVIRKHPELHHKEIISSLWGHGPLDVDVAAHLAGSGKFPGIEGELEEFIHRDEKMNPNDTRSRYEAARGIWKVTGRKILYKRGLVERHVFRPEQDPYPWDDKRYENNQERGDW